MPKFGSKKKYLSLRINVHDFSSQQKKIYSPQILHWMSKISDPKLLPKCSEMYFVSFKWWSFIWPGISSFTLYFNFQVIYDVFSKWHGIDLHGKSVKGFSIRNIIPSFFSLLCAIESMYHTLEMKSTDRLRALFLQGINVITNKKIL